MDHRSGRNLLPGVLVGSLVIGLGACAASGPQSGVPESDILVWGILILAVVLVAGIVVWMLAGYAVRALPVPWADALGDFLSVREHVADFARGVLDTRPVVLYLTGTWFLLFASVRALESRRWR